MPGQIIGITPIRYGLLKDDVFYGQDAKTEGTSENEFPK